MKGEAEDVLAAQAFSDTANKEAAAKKIAKGGTTGNAPIACQL